MASILVRGRKLLLLQHLLARYSTQNGLNPREGTETQLHSFKRFGCLILRMASILVRGRKRFVLLLISGVARLRMASILVRGRKLPYLLDNARYRAAQNGLNPREGTETHVDQQP